MDACWKRPHGVVDDSRITGNVAAWRAAFPAARAVNVSFREDLRDADFAHIRGGPGVRLHTVLMAHCTGVTDAAFAHLRGVHTLDMRDHEDTHSWSWTSFMQITDAAFAHLRGIHTLDMSHCCEITDAAFNHLAGIHTLCMSKCIQISDAAFVHLRGIHTLNMSV